MKKCCRKKFFCIDKTMRYCLLISAILGTLFLGCNDNSTGPENSGIDSTAHARKPNLYIYPESGIDLTVTMAFPLGGEIIKSDPPYQDGWNVSVEPGGIINKEFRYLFYEYSVPDFHQRESGWVIKKENLEEFFNHNMSSAGFSYIEIRDFTEFWIPELIEYPYYAIYPQFRNTLDIMCEIKFSTEPDNVFRLQYLIKGLNYDTGEIEQPVMEKAVRDGFYAVEWGVIIK